MSLFFHSFCISSSSSIDMSSNSFGCNGAGLLVSIFFPCSSSFLSFNVFSIYSNFRITFLFSTNFIFLYLPSFFSAAYFCLYYFFKSLSSDTFFSLISLDTPSRSIILSISRMRFLSLMWRFF